MMKTIVGKLKDRPLVANLMILILVAIHWYVFPNTWDSLICSEPSEITTIYSTVLSVAAIQSAFAGVIVVFGLSTQPSAFTELRRQSGKALVDNWLSISYSGFLSAGISLIALLLLHMGGARQSVWAFELAVLICAHCVARLLWLLRKLIQVISSVDLAEKKKRLQMDDF